MPALRRNTKQKAQVTPEEVIWGVARRETASDQDDPLLHAGATQHAFLIGVDYEAICGFKPPLRSGFVSGTKSPQLALPGRNNPRCPKCSALITSVRTLDEEAEAERAEAISAEGAVPEDDAAEAIEDEHDEDDEDELDETLDVAEPVEAEIIEDVDEQPSDTPDGVGARDSAWAPRRSSARRGGRATVPQGKRSVLVQLPDKLLGSVIAADIEGERGELRVRSVAANDDGTIRITLNQTAPNPTDVMWFVVSGSQRS